MIDAETVDRHLQRWADEYTAAAEADGYSEWLDDLPDLDDPLEGGREKAEQTIELLTTIAAYQQVDHALDMSRFEAVLKKQTYRSADSPARYAVYFSGGPIDEAEVFLDRLDEIDLVDLHGSFGYAKVCVCLLHPDGQRIDEQETERLEQAILTDFRFDYTEEEISIVFERFKIGTIATVRQL